MPSFYSGAMRIDTHYSFDNVIELLLDAVCVVDPDGRFVFVSAACERIFGYTPEEMLGRRSIDLVHPDDRERSEEHTSELQSLMRSSYADFCLKKKKQTRHKDILDMMLT